MSASVGQIDTVSTRVQDADEFVKRHVYSSENITFNAQGKLVASSTAEKDNTIVTLTFAQSFDAKIAGKQGKQIQLSGPESSVMTHRWVHCFMRLAGPSH